MDIPNIIEGANQLVNNIAEFFTSSNKTYLIGGCAACINAMQFIGNAYRPAFDIDIVCNNNLERSRKMINLGNFAFGIDVIPHNQLKFGFEPQLESTKGTTHLLIRSGEKSTSLLDIHDELAYESLDTLLPNKAYLMKMYYLSRLGEMSKEIFDIAMMSRFLDNSTVFKLGVDSPDILGLFYLSSAMVLAKSSHIVHRNISGVDNKTIIQASENGASHFYSVNEEHLKSIADERPMLLPVMLFNIYDVYMKGKKDAIANIDSAANNHLKKELSIINLNIIDALRRPDAQKLKSIIPEITKLMRSEPISKSTLLN